MKTTISLIGSIILLVPPSALGQTTFTRVDAGDLTADLNHSYGCAWVDFDDDGAIDIFVANGFGQSNCLYRNLGDGTFAKVTEGPVVNDPMDACGGVWGDYDNDGDLDLFVTNFGAPVKDAFYRNEGGGSFERILEGAWVNDNRAGVYAAWGDYDQDGYLDLVVGNSYGQRKSLFHNLGDGTTEQILMGAIPEDATEISGLLWTDYDNDGDLDLYVGGNKQRAGRIFRNEGPGGFVSLPGPGSVGAFTCGSVGADVNNDGALDLFLARHAGTSSARNELYLGSGAGRIGFTQITKGELVTSLSRSVGTAIGDYDNDGYLDVFVANDAGQNNELFHNEGDGTFSRVLEGDPVTDGANTWGCAWGDYDNDGDLDLFVTAGGAEEVSGPKQPNLLYRNNGNGNNWLLVRLVGRVSNRAAIGAKVRVRATISGETMSQVREISGGSGYCSQNDLRAHFGLGDATTIEALRIEWPSGMVQELYGPAVNTVHTIQEAGFRTMPLSQKVALGASAQFTVSSSGNAYQWYLGDEPLAGETGPSLYIPEVGPEQVGRYSVHVEVDGGLIILAADLEIDPRLVFFTKIPMGTTVPSWGCAWGDYNGDGYPDLFVAEGTWTSKGACSLYRNNQDGSLTRLTAEEAGPLVEKTGSWMDGAWGDVDNDGDLDLFLTDCPATGTAQSALWQNGGDGLFTDVTSFDAGDLAGMPIWGDYDRDGRLDLFIANAWYQPPTDLRNALFLNRGDNAFERVAEGDLMSFRGQVQGAAAGDMDNDGDDDLLLNGNVTALFENDGNGSFRRVTTGFPAISGLTITPSWADYDNDGRMDVFVAVYNQTSQLLHNDGDGQWTAIPLGAARQTSCGMWADHDNDGDLDLFVARGQNTTTTCLFFDNNGDGTFTQMEMGGLTSSNGRVAGAAWADYDNNGFLDLFLTGHVSFLESLFRNHGNANGWILLNLVGTASNRAAIGAKVRLRATIDGKSVWQTRAIDGGNRHQNDLRVHFGLGDATTIDAVRIEWPSGIVQELADVPVNQILTVTEPPRLTSQGAGGFRVQCWIGQSFDVECSPDLETWTVAETITNTTGNLVFSEPEPSQHTCRYYRVVAR